ncbi:MAG: hypothetical protein ABIS92_18500 [Polyangia bacterium]
MVRRQFSAMRQVVALAPLLLLAVYVPGQMMLRCRMDGVIRATCCCPVAEDDQRSPPAEYGLKAPDCCEHQLSASARQPVEPASTTAARIAAPPLSGTLAFGAAPLSLDGEPARAHRAWRANGPPGDAGPALVLLKHAFLI